MLEARDRAVAPTGSLSIDSRRSRLAFDVRYFGVLRVRGEFRDVRGEIFGLDPRAFTASSVTAVVPVTSLATGIRLRDWHLSSSGYLAGAKYPEATFQSERVIPDGRAGARVVGSLTLRGIARDVVLRVDNLRFDGNDRRMRARARVSLSRRDFGVGWTKRAPWWDLRRYLINDAVHVMIDIEAAERSEES
ncbi:MAG: YceI family protein [Gemmatimonadaceae bacterium]